ncbi:hypothetical protein [Ornithinicoccus hortensis]|uniref:Uncharacterized protein n=1 Tax=Ornithinicoccus hortensis TaxID=82346 RepID=A0A542YMI8_9MICO|nr:hypothetical protein [Ornithinicoccus hortensis]TQL49174.1 hypothetical protein FB467_0239 [Ornithinicoccus hortensis]
MSQRARVGSRAGAAWAAVLLLLLSLGLPWTSPSQEFRPGTGPSCIADLSGEGGLICDYMSIGGGTVWVSGASGAQTPSRFFLVLAIVVVLWALASGRTAVTSVAAGLVLAAVALGLPAVLSGQVVALLAGAVLLLGRGPSGSWGRAAARGPSAAQGRPGG